MGHSNLIFSFFENNLINWFVLIGFLCWLVAKYMPNILCDRQDKINTALGDASRARAEGEAFLEAQKSKIANSEVEMDNILSEALRVSREMKGRLDAETQEEIAAAGTKIDLEIAAERQLVISKLRAATATAAVQLTQRLLPAAITDSARSRLLDQFVVQLEVPGRSDEN